MIRNVIEPLWRTKEKSNQEPIFLQLLTPLPWHHLLQPLIHARPEVRSGLTQAQIPSTPAHSSHLLTRAPTTVIISGGGGGATFFKVQRPRSFSFTLVILPPPTPEKPSPPQHHRAQLPSLRATASAEGVAAVSRHSERRALEGRASHVRAFEDGGGGGHFGEFDVGGEEPRRGVQAASATRLGEGDEGGAGSGLARLLLPPERNGSCGLERWGLGSGGLRLLHGYGEERQLGSVARVGLCLRPHALPPTLPSSQSLRLRAFDAFFGSGKKTMEAGGCYFATF